MNDERILHFSTSLEGRQSLESALVNFPHGGHKVTASAATVPELESLLCAEADYSLVLIDRRGLTFNEMGQVKKLTAPG